jgi:hypothetical protein
MDSKPGNSNNLDSKTATSSNVTPAVYILVQNPITTTPKDKHFEKTFPKKVVIILSYLQMIAFALAFISQVNCCYAIKAKVTQWLRPTFKNGLGVLKCRGLMKNCLVLIFQNAKCYQDKANSIWLRVF